MTPCNFLLISLQRLFLKRERKREIHEKYCVILRDYMRKRNAILSDEKCSRFEVEIRYSFIASDKSHLGGIFIVR